MVLAFFKNNSDDGNFDHIVTSAVAMLADARHSFDLATLVLLTDADPAAVADDVRDTDQRINLAEQELRSELIVHVSVQGTADIGSVLGFTLLLKKIERIGDQAKNILDLAENGVTLVGRDDIEELLVERQRLSELFADAGALLSDPDPSEDAITEYADRATNAMAEYQATIDSCMTSDRPGREVVPLAIYFRYLRRIVANLVGVVRSSNEPIPTIDYLEDGMVDTED
ncbi:MAG: PhoU domain-containing protein [Acidimicrobiia bacterium]|nr:PhoU domain-containing protein [Acidimicrobiia bacterium]